MGLRSNEPASLREFKEGQALVRGCAGDDEEVPSVFAPIPAIALCNISCDGDRSAVELICEVVFASREGLRQGGNAVCEIHGFMIDSEVLHEEGHGSREATEARCRTTLAFLSLTFRLSAFASRLSGGT